MVSSSVVLFCLLAGSISEGGAAIAPTAQDTLSIEEESALREEMAKPGASELGAIDFADEYGQRALPLLLRLLGEDRPPESRSKIALYLGKVGGEQAAEALIHLIEAPMPAQMEDLDGNLLHSAIRGLGYAATEDAVMFLGKLMSDEYWLRRKDLPKEGAYRLDALENRLSIRKAALYALGCTLREDVLDRLEKGEGVPADLAKDIPNALEWARATKANEKNLREFREKDPPPTDPRARSRHREHRVETTN